MMKIKTYTQQELIDMVLEQIKKDVESGDMTASGRL